jgi:hypothetical protein
MGRDLNPMRRQFHGAEGGVEGFELIGFFVALRRARACENTLDSRVGET